jgi:hypothetical protein
VTIDVAPSDEVDSLCQSTTPLSGCAYTWSVGGFNIRARIIIANTSGAATIAHELGHVAGLAHIDASPGDHPPMTMGVTRGLFSPSARADSLDPASAKAVETVYAAGLTPGSTRTQLAAAGLLDTAGVSSTSLTPSATWHTTAGSVETVEIRPLCH